MKVSEERIKNQQFISYIVSIIGWLLFVGSIIAIGMLSLLFFATMQWVILPIVALLVVMAVGLGMIVWGMMMRSRIRKLQLYHNIVGERKQISLEELSRKSNQSVGALTKELETIISMNLLTEAYIDHEKKRLVLDTSATEEELAAEEAKKPQETIEGSEEFIRQLKVAGHKIKSTVVSVHIWHIESTAGKIFDAVNENPEKAAQLRKFFSYYMPTTIKLLNAYQVLEKQGIDQSNIAATKARIEEALETIGLAFEKLLDQLFSKEALDITTDIKVLESLLQQDGIGPEI